MAKEISNLITFNTYKFERGGLLVDMFNQFNARVGDQGTELAIQWETSKTETKINLKERGLHFFGTGSVGQYLEKLEDGTGFKMSADASTVEWEDKDEAGSLDDGITVVKLPKHFFPQKGIFFGYFGLKDRQGNIFTSVNVWFRVLGGVPTMGAAIPYFVTEFDEVLERCNGKIVDALAELREKYQAEVKKNEDMSAETRAALSKLADAVGAIQAQIDAGNVITRKEYLELANKIENTLAKMNLKPETFENEAALRAKYPSGVEGELKVTADTGHKWLYVNGNWKDCGVFQSAGYPEVDEARIGAKHLGAKEYASLSEAIHRQVDGLSNLGNQAFSYPITGIAGQQVSLQSEYEVGLQAGATLKVKFDLAGESDLSVIQVYANGAWFASIEAKNFGKWLRFKLDNDVNTLGLVIPADKFSKNFNGNISFQVITVPVAEMQKKLEQLSLYEVPVSLSTSKDELLPDGISGLTLDSGSKIFVRLKVDSSEQVVKNYQLTVNGKFFTSFNDNNWHEVKLTDPTTSLGFQAFQASILKDCDGTFQVVGNTLGNVYRDIDSDKEAIDRRFSKLLEESLSISASSDSDDVNTTAVKSLTLPKGSKIRVQFSPEDGSGSVEGYQVYANGKYLISYQDVDTWHEITLPDDTDSLGYAFYKERVHGQLKGNFKIIGGSFNDMYTILSSDDEAGTDGLTKNVTTQLLEKEKRINEINDGITNGISFIWMTDPHFPSNDLLSKPSMKHILNHTSIPFVLCGGDYPGAYGTKDDVLVSRDEVLEYQDYIGKGKFFSVQANHDFTIKKSPTDSSGYTAANSLVYNTLIRPNEFYLSSVQAGKEYYYIDIPSQSTRIFMLNSMDGNPETENTDAWGTQYTISQAQADWLVEKAKEKSGWKYVFVCHVPCDSNLDSYHPNEEYFHQVAAAINNKQKLSFHDTGINEDADFASTTNEVVTILAGHNHVDQSSSKDGVLSITTTSDARYSDGGWARQPQSYTSPAFDVVSIDYDKGTINTTRIGGGQDRVFSYVAPNQGEEIDSLSLQPIADLTVNGTTKCVVDMATPMVPKAIEWSNNCFTWSSSDSAVAEVNSSGVITARSSGTATITVSTRDGQHSDHCSVTVK
ncbi:Ig-like domain-containing protein [Limosilactobacillus reuteri]|uniref:Ig-like domain-containing protein n=1 Tax=Limosilactobacillus reuteri TaxID=1598 RepID=UPI002E7AEAAD|nr:Ig-like domain-containing protein [Limosilactobacillus reuteri]MEE1989233.1 Ig-like domain-containing protein [Limosilactobacillus reuteri]